MVKTILITGATGFIGSHFCEHIQAKTDWEMHLIGSFRHRGDSRRLASIDPARYTLYPHDLRHPIGASLQDRIGPVDSIFHFAAESHVDRSLAEPMPFVQNNVAVTLNLLEYARAVKPRAVFQISTDEVYGPALDGEMHREWSPILPSNPYAASKAAQEAIAISYWRSYGVPVVITNTMNNFGERQDREKFVPSALRAILNGDEVVIHGAPGNIGSRIYLHARNHADALLAISQRNPGLYPARDKPDRFNVVGDTELDNLQMAELIAEAAGKPLRYKLLDFHAARPGHDRRYALDGGLLARFGWKAPVPFQESLAKAIRWTMDNPEWLT